MSEKITIELTQEQVDNLNTIIQLGTEQHQNSKLVRDSLPAKLTKGNQYKIPKDEPTVEFLITMGSIGDRGKYRSGEFVRMFKKFAKIHPKVATEYLDILFQPAKKRGFYFTADFRKDVARAGLEADVLPDIAKLYYVKTYATKGSNAHWVIRNLESGNLPDKAWDIFAASKRYDVLKYTIKHGPENVLPLLLPSIANSKRNNQYSGTYSRKNAQDYSQEYLEYLFEHRVAIANGKIEKWSPLIEYRWMKSQGYK